MLSKLQLNTIPKNVIDSVLTHICNCFSTFYFDTIRLHVVQVKQNATHLSQHDSHKGVHVREITLWVTSGAPHSKTKFSLTYCKLNIYCNYNAFGDTYPPDLIVRNVWRTSPFDSVGHPGPPPWPVGVPTPFEDLWSGNFRRRERHAHEDS